MTEIIPSPADIRRLTVRIVADKMLRVLASLARVNGGDTIELLVFTAVWTANTSHLTAQTQRYAHLHDIPPDSQRRPVSREELIQSVCMPAEIVDLYVGRLIDKGLVEQVNGGLVSPSAVFTRPEMLDGANELYGWVVGLAAALRGAGFGFGEDARDAA